MEEMPDLLLYIRNERPDRSPQPRWFPQTRVFLNISFVNVTMLHSASFTPDGAFLTVGLPEGFVVYSTSPWSLALRCPFCRQVASRGLSFPGWQVSVLLCDRTQPAFSNAMICVFLWFDQRVLKTFEFSVPVCNLVCNSQMFAFAFQSEVYVYLAESISLAGQYNCVRNPLAPAALADRDGEQLLAFTGRRVGYLKIVSLDHADRKALAVNVAEHSLAIICFSRDGTKVATASERGTLVRVYNTFNGDPVARFRRGSFPANIASIAFGETADVLAVLSDHGTVHLFEVEGAEAAGDDEPPRAVMTWKMAHTEPAVVEFPGTGAFVIVRIRSGEIETVWYNVEQRKTELHSKVVLTEIK
jgi:WD40 repeat protein